MSGKKLFTFLLLGAILFHSVDSARGPRQRDVVDEESCEEDDGAGSYDDEGRPNRVGSIRRKQSDDDWDGVEDPTDDDYLRYENSNQEGICLLERGKCPAGDWRMFKRGKESVCLKIIGRKHSFDGQTAGEICRLEANARIMTVDSFEERQWIYTTPLGGNISYPHLLIAGYRNRECRKDPLKCIADQQKAFVQQDGTSDHKYIYSKWGGLLLNRWQYGYLDDCISFRTAPHDLNLPYFIHDETCHENFFYTVLCGVTVM
ncbi:unnamed protein product [Caenorhabditis brenneri]